MGHNRETCPCCIEEKKHRKLSFEGAALEKRIISLEAEIAVLRNKIDQKDFTIAISTKEIK